jgi:hypothetical protein
LTSAEARPTVTGWILLVQRRTVAVEVIALFRELAMPFRKLAAVAFIADTVLLSSMDVIHILATLALEDGAHCYSP